MGVSDAIASASRAVTSQPPATNVNASSHRSRIGHADEPRVHEMWERGARGGSWHQLGASGSHQAALGNQLAAARSCSASLLPLLGYESLGTMHDFSHQPLHIRHRGPEAEDAHAQRERSTETRGRDEIT